MAQNIDKILNNVLGITTVAMLATVAAVGVSGGYYSHVKYGSFNVLKATNCEENFKSFVQKNKNNQDLLNSRNFEAVKCFMDSGARMRMLIAFPQKDANGTIVGWDFRAYRIRACIIDPKVESTIGCALPVIDDNGNITFGDMRQGIALQEWEKLKQRLKKCGCKFDLDAVSQFLKDKEKQIRKAEQQAVALKKVEEAKKVSEKIHEILERINKKGRDALRSKEDASLERCSAKKAEKSRVIEKIALSAIKGEPAVRDKVREAVEAEGEKIFYVSKINNMPFAFAEIEKAALDAEEDMERKVILERAFAALKNAILSSSGEEILLEEEALNTVNDAVRKASKKAKKGELYCRVEEVNCTFDSVSFGRSVTVLSEYSAKEKARIKNALDEVVKAMNKRRDVVFDEIRLRAKIELCDKKINEFSIIKQAALDTAEADKKDGILREFDDAVKVAYEMKEKGLPMGDVKLDALVNAVVNAQEGAEEAVKKAEETVEKLKAKEDERDALCREISEIKTSALSAYREAKSAIETAERAVAGYVENAEKAEEEVVKKAEKARRLVEKSAKKVEELIKSLQ